MRVKEQNTSSSKKEVFDVHLPNLLNEVLSNQSAAILKIPIAVTKSILSLVAKRAIELDDPELNILMLRLALYDVPMRKRLIAISRQLKRMKKKIK